MPKQIPRAGVKMHDKNYKDIRNAGQAACQCC